MNNRGSHIPQKALCVPGAPAVDVSELTALLDHPYMQKLRERRQLGVNYLVFPGAAHSRFEHTIGVLGLTQKLSSIHGLDSELARHLEVFALLHDIGHGPFSHQIEPVLGDSHHNIGLHLIEQMTDAIKACGSSVAWQKKMFTNAHPAASYITDRNLGLDKLDYLYRDALHIGFSGMPDVENVLRYSKCENGEWMIEEKFVEDVKRIQKFYSYLHQHGYLGKTALSIQRVFQRAVQERLAETAEEPLRRSQLWHMDDHELLTWLEQAHDSGLACRLRQRLMNRQFHRTLGVIKPVRYGFVERRDDGDVVVKEWSREKLQSFCDSFTDCATLKRLENEAAAALALEPGEALFAAMPYFERLVPKDVRVFSNRCGTTYSLFENDRDHYRSLIGDYLRTFAIRLIVAPEKRDIAKVRVRDFFKMLEERTSDTIRHDCAVQASRMK